MPPASNYLGENGPGTNVIQCIPLYEDPVRTRMDTTPQTLVNDLNDITEALISSEKR